MAAEVKFEAWFSRGFELFKKNAGLLILTSFVAILLTSISFGILAGPMCAGMILITLRLLRGTEPKPEFGALFEGFQHFLQSFLFCFVWGLIFMVGATVLNLVPCVGWAVSFAGSLILGALLTFGLFLVVDKRMDFWPASMASINAIKPALWPMVGFCIVVQLLAQAGAIACFVGMFVTVPMAACMLAVAYEEFLNGPAAPPPAPAPAPETPPTPPPAPEPPAA